jgi:hypothetical protein
MRSSTLTVDKTTAEKPRAVLARSEAAERMLALTGTTRLSDADLAVTMFGFPLILTLANAVDGYRSTAKDGRGRRQHFPTAALIAISAIARYVGSLPAALRVLNDFDVWHRCRRAWESLAGVGELPDAPPPRHSVSYLRDLINDDEQVIEVLKDSFTGGAFRMAQLLGNFPMCEASLLTVDPAHTIFGDGTILRPMSDVIEHVNELTGEIEYLGSRATSGAPRVQRAVRTLDADHPGQVGINFVAMHTETSSGLVVLGIESTLSAEQWAALIVTKRIDTHAHGSVHNLVYDGALTGWVEDALMCNYGVQLLQKGRSRGEDRSTDQSVVRILDIDARVAAETADRLAERDIATGETGTTRSAAYLGRVHTTVRRDVFDRMWRSGEPLPVGTSLYPSAKGDSGYDIVNSRYNFLHLTFDSPDGGCEHDLVIDDGALFTVGLDEQTDAATKFDHLPCMAAQRERVGEHFTVTLTYLVPCDHGDHEWTHTWAPDMPAYTEHDERPATHAHDRVGRPLSPIPRIATDEFAPVLRLRNYSESYNNWFKAALPRHGRAAAMTQRGQEFDFLMGALAANAVTWHHAQQ